MKRQGEHVIMKEIQIALCGNLGHPDKFAGLINSYEESRLCAVWDSDEKAGRERAGRLGVPFYADFDELLKMPGLTGLVICTRNFMKKELALKAAAAGKHIFMEKPLALCKEDAWEICRAVKDSGVKFFMTDPFVDPDVMWIRDFMEGGNLGRILSLRIRFHSISMERMQGHENLPLLAAQMGGGMMMDTGNHPVHALYFLLGKPQKVYGLLGYADEEAKRVGYDQFATEVFSYADGLTAILEDGLVSPGAANCIEVCGTKGIVVDETFGMHQKKPQIRYYLEEEGDAWHYVSEDDLPQKPDDHIRYFVRMLAEDIPNEMVGIDPLSHHGVSLDTAVEMAEIADAFYESVKTGKAIQVGGIYESD